MNCKVKSVSLVTLVFCGLLGIGWLQREGQSQEAVLKVLNLFSMEVYEDRNAGWWVTKFHSSKLAAILSKKPREEWIILPE